MECLEWYDRLFLHVVHSLLIVVACYVLAYMWRRWRFRRNAVPCWVCHGRGYAKSNNETCWHCGGPGELEAKDVRAHAGYCPAANWRTWKGKCVCREGFE